MKIPTSAVFLSLLCSTSAFIIPAGLEEGVTYTVALGPNGTTVGEPVIYDPEATKSAHKGRMELVARVFPSITTECEGYSIDGNNLDNAQAMFTCNGQWVQPDHAIYRYYGSAIVYMCNYGQWNPCHSSEFWDAMQIIGTQCSWYGAGNIDIPSWKKGYGRANLGADICWFDF